MKTKKILFISNIYLPQKTGGTQRICKFFECLNEKPFETFLVTTKDYLNESLYEKNVFRTHDLFQFFKSKKNEKKSKKQDEDEKDRHSLISIIKRYIFLFFCFPDEHLTFIFFAFFQSIKIIRRNKIDYVISTYPSVTNLITGWLISLIFGKKHILDLRETWLDTPDWSMKYDNTFLVKIRIKIENFFERKIIDSSYLVILNNKWMRQLYERKYGNNYKYVIIPNGFDEDIIKSIEAEKNSNDKIKIVYAGSYYLKHQPDYIFKGIRRAIELHHELKNNIEFNIYGSIDEKTENLIREYSACFSIKYFSYLNRKDVFERIATSDLGIISFPPIKWSLGKIPGKIYEYKKIGVDILAIGEKNSALQYLAEELNEKFIYAKDTESIANFLVDFSNMKDRNYPSKNKTTSTIEDYNYFIITKKIRGLFL